MCPEDPDSRTITLGKFQCYATYKVSQLMSEVWNEKGVKPIFYFKITGFLWKPKHDTLKFSSKKKSLETGQSKEENRIQT